MLEPSNYVESYSDSVTVHVSGLILDATGRYEYVYLFSGSLLLMAALSLSAIPLIECVKNKFSKDD